PAKQRAAVQIAPKAWRDSSLAELQKALVEPDVEFSQAELASIRQQLLQMQIAVEQRIGANPAASVTEEMPQADARQEEKAEPQSDPTNTREDIYRQIRQNRGAVE